MITVAITTNDVFVDDNKDIYDDCYCCCKCVLTNNNNRIKLSIEQLLID